MPRKMVVFSDLSGQMVPENDEVTLIIKEFPGIDDLPVQLDASTTEVKPLLSGGGDFVLAEVRRGDQVRNVVIDLATFTAAFAVDPYQALKEAKRVKVSRASNGTKSNTGELSAIREWATANGYEVAAKGRVKQEIVDAYRAAQAA